MDYKYKDLFLQDSVKKELHITYDSGEITNAELHSNQFELRESICSENELRFGGCEASCVKFKISNIFESLVGKEIDVSMVLDGHADVPFKFGKYRIFSDTPTADRAFKEIVAYDKMYDIINADVAEWYNNLEFPMSMKEFRTSFVSYFDLEQVENVLINDDMVIDKTIDTVELSGRDVARAICETNACFGYINRDGEFDYIILRKTGEELYPSDMLYPGNNLYPLANEDATNISKRHYISCKYEDFVTGLIEAVEVRPEEESAGAIVGNESGNIYVLSGNFLLYGKTVVELEAIARNILSIVEDIQYRPAEISAIGNPTICIGGGICLNTKNEIINTYVLQRVLSGIQGLRDSYSAEGVERYNQNINSTRGEILKLKAKTNKLTKTAEETKLEMEDLGKNIKSEIVQTAEGLRIEMNDANNSQTTNIISDAEKIIFTALEEYVKTENMDEFKSTVSTQLSIMNNQIVANFETSIDRTNSIETSMNEEFEKYSKRITMSNDGIEIHDVSNTLTLSMDSDGISFKKNGEQFGLWDGNDFYTGNIVVRVEERAQFGNYAFVPRSNGSLSFLKVGG